MRSDQVLCAVYKTSTPLAYLDLIRGRDWVRGRGEKIMKNPQSDKKTTKQVRFDAGLHRLLKIEAARRQMTVKSLIEECLTEILEVKGEEYD